MIPVSDDYKLAIKKDIREFDMTAILIGSYGLKWNYKNSYSISNISEESSVYDDSIFTLNYASLEQDYFKLDGSFILPNEYYNKYSGFITDNINVYPKITLSGIYPEDEDEQLLMKKIYIVFKDDYATKLDITYTKNPDDVSPETRTVSITNNNKILEIIIPSDFLVANNEYEIEITFKDCVDTNHRIRIEKITSEKPEIIENREIISSNMLEQTDLYGTSTPNNSFSLKVINYDRRFNILQKDNILNRLRPGSIIKFYIGIKTNNIYEYLQYTNFYYISYKETDDKTIEFTYQGYTLNSGEKGYYFTLPTLSRQNEFVTLENAYSNIIEDDGEDSSLIEYKNDIPIRLSKCQNVDEERIAFLTFYNASIKQPRDGYAKLQAFNFNKLNENIEDYYISLTMQTKNPIFTKYQKTKKIIFRHNELLSKKDTKTEIYKGQIDTKTGTGKIQLTLLNPIDVDSIDIYCNDILIMKDGEQQTSTFFGVIVKASYYYVDITINPPAPLLNWYDSVYKIQATEYNTNEITTEILNNDDEQNEAIIELNNETIRTANDRKRISNYIFNQEQEYPFEFEIEILGDMRLEVGDRVYIQGLEGYHRAIITYINSDYNGGYKQQIKGVCSNVLQ